MAAVAATKLGSVPTDTDCKGRIVREDEILKAIGENTVQRVDVMEAGLKVS